MCEHPHGTVLARRRQLQDQRLYQTAGTELKKGDRQYVQPQKQYASQTRQATEQPKSVVCTCLDPCSRLCRSRRDSRLPANADPAAEERFTPAQVSCEVEETFDGSVKRSVAIRNTGDTDAFIRVTVVANWVKADDEGNVTSVHAQQPQPGTDYTIQWADDFGANWLQGGSDFYYYKIAVDPEESTAVLIAECTPKANRAPEGYTLAVEIVASAIQASPEAVAEEYWHISVENGVITAVQGGGGNE